MIFKLQGKLDAENQNGNHGWEEYLERYVKNLKCSPVDKENLKKAINGIRSRLIMTAKHELSKVFLNHAVLFKQRPSASSIEKVR